jgi:hypothetical protein
MRFVHNSLGSELVSPAEERIVGSPRPSRGASVVQPDPVISAINRYRAARAEVDRIAVREPMLPNGNPADETEEYATWETANLKATDGAATAWTEVTTTPPTTVAGAIALIECYLEIWSERPAKLAYPEASRALRGLRAFLREYCRLALRP